MSDSDTRYIKFNTFISGMVAGALTLTIILCIAKRTFTDGIKIGSEQIAIISTNQIIVTNFIVPEKTGVNSNE